MQSFLHFVLIKYSLIIVKILFIKKIYEVYKRKGFLGLLISCIKYINPKTPKNPNISLKYRACFIHIPKCGGTSIEQLIFNPYNDRYSIGADGGKYYGADHSTILAFSKYYHFYIFTFVRNPYTRIISVFNYYMNNGNGGYSDSTLITDKKNTSLDNFLEIYNCNQISHLNTQFFYLKDSKNINYIAKFENYNKELEKILSILNIKNKRVNHYRKTIKFKNLITPKFIEKVNQIYEIDFIKYNYKMITLKDSIEYDKFVKNCCT